MGHRSFRELIDKLPPERRNNIHSGAKKLAAKMELAELREALQMRQTDLAKKMQVTQAAVSQIENQDETQISTIARYVGALGGSLELHVVLPNRVVVLKHASSGELAKAARALKARHDRRAKAPIRKRSKRRV